MHFKKIRLDASTVCQLRCPACSHTKGLIKKNLGESFLSFEIFRSFIDKNPQIACIELSNYGEIFLNPELYDIIEYAYRKNVVLMAGNGVNLNTTSEKILEGLVKYNFLYISCSLDGANQKTYEIYRRGGNFNRVIENIKIINYYKHKYGTILPLMRWSFVVFDHNGHDINIARKMAKDLGMSFILKSNWDRDYSPIKYEDKVKLEKKFSMSFYKRHNRLKPMGYCENLWSDPQLNWDGRILGCCCNYWGDFGNAFILGIKNGLNGEKIEYARQMLMGKTGAREDIPCTICKHYKFRLENRNWVRKTDIWTFSIIIQDFIYFFIHAMGWKKIEPMLHIINYVLRLFKKPSEKIPQ